MVFANDEDMKTIEDIIGKLDVVLAQVLIEAVILEVNLTDSRNVGFSALQPALTTHGNVTGAGGVNNFKLRRQFIPDRQRHEHQWFEHGRQRDRQRHAGQPAGRLQLLCPLRE